MSLRDEFRVVGAVNGSSRGNGKWVVEGELGGLSQANHTSWTIDRTVTRYRVQSVLILLLVISHNISSSFYAESSRKGFIPHPIAKTKLIS